MAREFFNGLLVIGNVAVEPEPTKMK